MASTYPTSLDTFTNPLATDVLTSPSHAQQHADINDAVEALETKVAIGATVLGTYIAYTPTFAAGLTVGNGTSNARFTRVNNVVNYYGHFILGTTSAVTGAIRIDLPVTANSLYATINGQPMGDITFYDASTGTWVKGETISIGSTTTSLTRLLVANGTFLTNMSETTSTNPFIWTTSDQILWNITYQAA